MPENVKTAVEYLNKGEFKQSIEIYQKIMPQLTSHKSKSNISDSLLNLSMAYLLFGEYGKCKQTCANIIKLYPNLEEGYIHMIICLSYIHKYDQSIRLCDDRLKVNDRNWQLYFAKGYVLDRMRKFQEAAQCFSIAIAKNLLNNPQTYMLQAATLVCLDEYEAAAKSIHYAQLAMQEDQNKNCAGHYKFAIKNMKAGLKSYQEYMRRLKKAEEEHQISKSERQNFQKQLIKVVGKSVDYRSTAFRYFSGRQNQEIMTEEANYSQNRQLHIKNQILLEQSDFWNELLIFDESFKLKIKESYKFKTTTKDTISEEILSKNQGQNKIICEWLRQKCSIF